MNLKTIKDYKMESLDLKKKSVFELQETKMNLTIKILANSNDNEFQKF